jgi:hypothetical protein
MHVAVDLPDDASSSGCPFMIFDWVPTALPGIKKLCSAATDGCAAAVLQGAHSTILDVLQLKGHSDKLDMHDWKGHIADR